MNTRENKYSNNVGMSRVAKNNDLYKQINNSELDNFNVRSNATVIGNQEREIDVEQIKKILDKRYNSAPKRRSIRIEERPHENIISDEPTKEYDLTKVLEKAKDEKVETYEENRAKKLRNTQYNILSNLNIDGEEKEEVKATPEENLMNLINTITINEAKKLEEKNSNSNDIDPLDILSDLKGDDDTQVYESMETEVTKITEIKDKEKEKENNNQITEVKNKNQEKLDNSFYTSNLFKKNDFEDDNKDFVDDEKIGIGFKILIVLVIVTFLVGLFLFLKSYLKF